LFCLWLRNSKQKLMLIFTIIFFTNADVKLKKKEKNFALQLLQVESLIYLPFNVLHIYFLI